MFKVLNACILVAAVIEVDGSAISLKAQSTQVTNQPASVSANVSLSRNSYAVGEKPVAVLTIVNTSSNELWFSTASHLYRVHITTTNGEPPKTELHRHMLGDVHPGDGPVRLSGPVAGRSIQPGGTTSQKYELSAFYDLSTRGNYNVYIEIYDPGGAADSSGHWIRTNTVGFEIKAAS